MEIPSFTLLKKEIAERGFAIGMYSSGIHPNPRHYKYYWSVFHLGSPCDGREFLDKKFWLPTKKAFVLMDELASKKINFWLYNRNLPRLSPDNPFDLTSEKWRDSEFAVAYEDDTDEAIQIGENVHK